MKKKILEDHTKKGKVLQPPLLTMATFVETAWLDYAVPEFIWILILIEQYGVKQGCRLSLEFANISDQFIISKTNNGSAATIVSYYDLLSDSEKVEIIDEMKRLSLLTKFQKALLPFLKLYPKCPLSFIISENADVESKVDWEYVESYKKNLGEFLDKSEFKSSIVMANVIGFLSSVDRFHITLESKVPELDEIFSYPETEESKHLASFLRSSISLCFNVEWDYKRDNDWVRYFWNQSIKIEPCKL
jgi:hypothetical protein